MKPSDSLAALRSLNPRANPDFAADVEAATATVHALVATGNRAVATADVAPRRRSIRVLAIAAPAAAVVAALVIGMPGGGARVDDAAAAVMHAGAASASAAASSGTANVRITHDGTPWASVNVRWNGNDIAVSHGRPGRERAMIVAGGVLYGNDPSEGGWLELGDPASIDPGSGTTPSEYLAAVRGAGTGALFRRMTATMTAPAHSNADGSTTYSGRVPAAVLAPETGFKEGEHIRVLPFGYVAHGAAADPETLVETRLTVGAGGLIESLTATWDGWSYSVGYERLGSTPAPKAPVDAKPLERTDPQ